LGNAKNLELQQLLASLSGRLLEDDPVFLIRVVDLVTRPDHGLLPLRIEQA
jgi:hypothetical protein